MNKKINQKNKVLMSLKVFLTMFPLLLSNGFTVQAANIGQNAANWATEQIFWIGLIFLLIAIVSLGVKRNFTAAITTALGGGVVLYFVKNPTKLADIGEAIANLIL